MIPSITTAIRWLISAAAICWMWTESGRATGLLACVVFLNGEISATLIRINHQRVERLEDAIVTSVQSVRDYIRQREQQREAFLRQRNIH